MKWVELTESGVSKSTYRINLDTIVLLSLSTRTITLINGNKMTFDDKEWKKLIAAVDASES